MPEPEPDGRYWPTLAIPGDAVRNLEIRVREEHAELLACRAELTDLHNVRNHHIEDMQIAQQVIDQLDRGVDALRTALREQEQTSAAFREQLLAAGREKSALKAELLKARGDLTSIGHTNSSLAKSNNDKDTVLAVNYEEIRNLKIQSEKSRADLARLQSELHDARREAAQSVEAHIAAKDRHQHEMNRCREHLSNLERDLRAAISKKESDLKTLGAASAELVSRCDEFAKDVQGLTTDNHSLRENLRLQTEQVQILETVLKIEREETQRVIQRLSTEIARLKILD